MIDLIKIFDTSTTTITARMLKYSLGKNVWEIRENLIKPFYSAKLSIQIVKVSGLNEIEERLGVLKMVKLISFDDFEASVKHLNDDRKEIELKIRKLQKETAENSTRRELIIEKIGKLEKDRNKIIKLISNAPKRENYLKRKQLLEERIEQHHKEMYRFCLDFIDELNEDLTPIKEKKGFSELYLNYDLTLTIQKKEKHKIVVCGKEHN